MEIRKLHATSKKKVRSGKNPATQIVKRIFEETVHEEDNLTPHAIIHQKRPENTFITSEGKYCEVVCVEDQHEEKYKCRVYYSKEALYMQPCDARILGFYKVDKNNYTIKIYEAKLLTNKCMMIDQGNSIIFLPLLHNY